MIFLTVGSEFPFDRLVQAADDLAAVIAPDEQIFAQIGDGKYVPKNMQWATHLDRESFDKYLQQSRAVISHAGMGTIIKCMELQKPLLVVPRQKRFGEHVNDHQIGSAKAFEAKGDVLAVYDIATLPHKFRELDTFKPPALREGPIQIVHCIRDFLQSVNA